MNHHLLKDLSDRGLWNDDIKNEIISHNGSIQKIESIPEDLKRLYRTVWEIPQKNLINMSADRGAYICQSQSLNIHIAEPTFGKMSSMHFYAWKRGLKTGLYYLRTRPAADPIKFTVDKSKLKAKTGTPVTNGHQNGKHSPKKAAHQNGVELIETTATNGYTNGHTNGYTNGHTNGHTNGETNGHTNGEMNGHTENGKTEVNGDSAKEESSNSDLIEQLKLACSLKNKEACLMCSS